MDCKVLSAAQSHLGMHTADPLTSIEFCLKTHGLTCTAAHDGNCENVFGGGDRGIGGLSLCSVHHDCKVETVAEYFTEVS